MACNPDILRQVPLFALLDDEETAVLAGQVKQLVAAAYKNVPFGQFTTMLTSGSPREFIDQLSTLGLLASLVVWKDVAHTLFNVKEFLYIR